VHIPEINPGTPRRATSGEPSPYHHGIVTQDEPNVPLKSYEKPIPVHNGMTDRQRAKLDPVADNAKNILTDAANLAKPPQKA
jgi:hypothetical protein